MKTFPGALPAINDAARRIQAAPFATDEDIADAMAYLGGPREATLRHIRTARLLLARKPRRRS